MPVSNLHAVTVPAMCFLLGQNARGLWVIRERTGSKAGLFVSREAALRFARQESHKEDYSVVQLKDGLEFDYAV